MPPGNAFHTGPSHQPLPASQRQVGSGPRFGMPVLALLPPLRHAGLKCPHGASAFRLDTRVLQRQVGHTMIQPLRIYAGTQMRGCAKECFQGQLASSSAQSLSAPELRARNPSNTQRLSPPWQSKKLPIFLKDVQHFIFLLPGGSQSEQGPGPDST